MPQENRKRNRAPVVSLLSPDPNTDIDRPLKRPQRDMSVCTSGPLVSSVTHRRCPALEMVC